MASKLLFAVKNPLPAKVYRAQFRPFAATEFINTKALKSVDKVMIECGTIEIAGKSVTLSADIRKGIITAIRPQTCAGCSPKRGKKAIAKSAIKELVKTVEIELAKRKTSQPKWPVGVAASASLGFRIPLGPIVIIIGTDPDEGVDVFDICIVITIDGESCIYCLFGPNACVTVG